MGEVPLPFSGPHFTSYGKERNGVTALRGAAQPAVRAGALSILSGPEPQLLPARFFLI